MTRDEFKAEVERVLGDGWTFSKGAAENYAARGEVTIFERLGTWWIYSHGDESGDDRLQRAAADLAVKLGIRLKKTIDRLTAARDAATPKGER